MYNSATQRLGLRLLVPLVALLTLGLSAQALAAPGVIEKQSKNGFDETVQKLKAAITAQNLVLLKDFNHQMMVKMVGVNAEPSMSFEVFHPRYGKVINATDRSAFVVAPLRIIVQQNGSKVLVYYQQASVLLQPYKGLSDLGKELDTLFGRIVDAAIQ